MKKHKPIAYFVGTVIARHVGVPAHKVRKTPPMEFFFTQTTRYRIMCSNFHVLDVSLTCTYLLVFSASFKLMHTEHSQLFDLSPFVVASFC